MDLLLEIIGVVVEFIDIDVPRKELWFSAVAGGLLGWGSLVLAPTQLIRTDWLRLVIALGAPFVAGAIGARLVKDDRLLAFGGAATAVAAFMCARAIG